MFAIIRCGNCRRPRIIDEKDGRTVCPYCGNADVTSERARLFRARDQELLRRRIEAITLRDGARQGMRRSPADTEWAAGSLPAEEETALPDPSDPGSVLKYEYKRASGPEAKMEILAEGLDRIYGEWTVDDLRQFEPKNAEKMLSAMLDRCLVYETKYGRYKRSRCRFRGCLGNSSLSSPSCSGNRLP